MTSSNRSIKFNIFQVVEILSMVKASVKDKPEPSSVFYDELANILEEGNIESKVLVWF